MTQHYWLLKSEPSTWSWSQQLRGQTDWTGIRNYQARNFMKQMKRGDLAFFYHSNEGKEIVGIVKVAQPYYPDPTDDSGKFGCVDVSAVRPLKTPVTLAQIKSTPALKNMALIRQSRLSVMPVTKEEWDIILELGKN
ncbi:MAG: ubiquinol-cytochrome C reductase [Alphaproteobacteria bacterium RIFCSPHIGHO2_01_FULL_41_14]|nr:MAG: ubiquinol-cytochrome C reductase [Alphaproteobacteria bacterium GWB1_45_5]OFW76137.1 MAG: ubiquinol-cytochrome C reductase [Alphaproteobacteria bacterium GWA1_45_9]OFW89573.1 MAG: ubiquinol-cytochrome C reductase [Alphaproteobacteria bacterium RIFCSPHIGHO2_01_FULL_41_14]HCI48464.1 EVE domain-containing protein [Holosporales bacterium]